MAVGNEQTTRQFNRNIKSNSHLVHYKTCQGVNKEKQVAFTTKWELGDNVVLRLVECLIPTVSFHLFTDNYFTSLRLTSFYLLTHIQVNNIRVRGTKIGYANTLSSGRNSCKN